MEQKRYEQRLRRLARRYGYELHKSRIRWPVDNGCNYMLAHTRLNAAVLIDASLEEVEEFLRPEE